VSLNSHPFASYCQKVLIALLENEIHFTYRHLEEPGAAEERAAFWLLGRFPVRVDDSRTIAEYPAQARSRDYLHGSCLQIVGAYWPLHP
jgi:glutathione S-transferase